MDEERGSRITERWQEEVSDRWGRYTVERRRRVDALGQVWQGSSRDGVWWLEVPEERPHL